MGIRKTKVPNVFLFPPSDDKDDLESVRALNALESVDDDCDRLGIALVKIDDRACAERNGIADLPALVFYERDVPNFYKGLAMFEATFVRHDLCQYEVLSLSSFS